MCGPRSHSPRGSKKQTRKENSDRRTLTLPAWRPSVWATFRNGDFTATMLFSGRNPRTSDQQRQTANVGSWTLAFIVPDYERRGRHAAVSATSQRFYRVARCALADAVPFADTWSNNRTHGILKDLELL